APRRRAAAHPPSAGTAGRVRQAAGLIHSPSFPRHARPSLIGIDPDSIRRSAGRRPRRRAMRFHADLHVHSKYSRATSRDLDLEHLAHWAARKGIGVVATGDFTHPAWCAELKEKLVPAEPGLFRLRDDIAAGVAATLPAACRRPVRFMLEVEISTIYKKGDKTRKVHHLIYAPDFATVDRINARLARIGNIASDGRPILGLDSRDLLEITLESDPGAYFIPA